MPDLITYTTVNNLQITLLLLIVSDINECSEYNGGCDHTCTNFNGSYSCACDNGYTLHNDNHSCFGKYTNHLFYGLNNNNFADINECTTDNGDCEHSCVNIDGSYKCTCDNGYMLDNNYKNCTGNWKIHQWCH